jgi:hypothetical protein
MQRDNAFSHTNTRLEARRNNGHPKNPVATRRAHVCNQARTQLPYVITNGVQGVEGD